MRGWACVKLLFQHSLCCHLRRNGIACIAGQCRDEPFDMGKLDLARFVPRRGPTWREWRKIIANVETEMRELAKCRTEADRCNAAERRFETIVKEARSKNGRAKIELSTSGSTVKSVMNRTRHNGVSRMPGRCPLISTKRVLSTRV
jgi:hypothetical protein